MRNSDWLFSLVKLIESLHYETVDLRQKLNEHHCECCRWRFERVSAEKPTVVLERLNEEFPVKKSRKKKVECPECGKLVKVLKLHVLKAHPKKHPLYDNVERKLKAREVK